MKKFNKMLSVLLSLVLCAGMVVPGFAASFSELQGAINTGNSVYQDGQDETSETTGADKYKIEASKGEDDKVNVTLWEDVEKGEDDLTGVTVESGSNVELNLNDHNITGDDEHDVISVKQDASLTINGGEAEPETPDETEAETPDEGEEPAEPETPKNTITGNVENRGILTVNKATVDGNVNNHRYFYLSDSTVTKTVTNDKGAYFGHTNSTVGEATGFYGDGGRWELETVDGGKKLTIYPDSTKEISGRQGGYRASWLYNNNLSFDDITEIEIKEGVETIGNNAFFGCRGLTSVTIPDSVTSIGEYAFYYCSGLTSVTIPDSVKSIGVYAFTHCWVLTSVTIPDSVTSIGDYAFYGCRGLTSVTIPDSVTSIGDCAFYDCSGLKSVTIPDSVTSIENCAFSGCSSLESVTIPNSVTSIGNSAFCGCSSLTSVTIGDSVESIGERAFYACGLESVTIPGNVKTIGGNAFWDCKSLKSVTISEGVESIERWAFFNCSSLTSVTIPDSVTFIGAAAFNICTSLTSVEMPADVKIDGEAFYNCRNLKYVLVTGANDEQKADNKGFDRCNVYVFSEDENDNTVTFFHGDTPVTLTLDDVEAFKESINRTDGSVTFKGDKIGDEALSECDTVTIATNGNITKKTEHTEVTDEAVEPTCTTTGLTEGSHCSVCGTTITAQTVLNAKGHDMTVEIKAKDPTCTEDGNEAGKQCSRCDHTEGAEVIGAKGHDMKEVADSAVAPTCTTAGKEADMACSRCDHKVTGAELPATKHNPGEPAQENVVEARPGVPGSYDLVTRCTKCTEILESEHVVTSVDVTLDVSGGGTTHVGETIDLTVETNVDPEDDPVVWESSDPTIATVDENGKVTGVSEGTVTITATVGGVTVEMEITVTAVPVAPSTRPSVTVSFDYVGGTTRIEDEEVPLAGLISRADVIGYLWQKAGSPEAELSDFADVPEDHEWAVAIGWAQQSGIAVADEDGNFRPDDLLLRSVESLEISPEGELQEFLNRYAVYAGIELDEGELFIELAGSWDDAIMGEEAQEILNDFFARLEEALADIAA